MNTSYVMPRTSSGYPKNGNRNILLLKKICSKSATNSFVIIQSRKRGKQHIRSGLEITKIISGHLIDINLLTMVAFIKGAKASTIRAKKVIVTIFLIHGQASHVCNL